MVHLDLRHLGEKKLHERLPVHLRTGEAYVGVDPVKTDSSTSDRAHYTMGGIETDQNCEPCQGLLPLAMLLCWPAHGANRLGSNSLAELVVFGRLAGEQTMERAATAGAANNAALDARGCRC